jgi:anti-sigma regulatory factor (Ser/Thr protein kinase)
LVSELVTNAIQRAREPVEVGVDMDDRLLRVEVYDDGEGLPRVEPESVLSDHGRGLRLVAAISDRWGVRPYRDRKCVWFELQRAPLTK